MKLLVLFKPKKVMSLFFFVVNKIIVAAAIGPIPSSMDFITIVNPYGKVILLYQSNSPSLNTPDNIVAMMKKIIT
jgi:hypothetical protein